MRRLTDTAHSASAHRQHPAPERAGVEALKGSTTMMIIRTASLYGRKLNVHSHPRAIAGGSVVWVSWATNDDAPASVRLRDGSVHPCHAAGFTWEDCTTNLSA